MLILVNGHREILEGALSGGLVELVLDGKLDGKSGALVGEL